MGYSPLKNYLLFFLLFSFQLHFAQCFLKEVSLADRVSNADLVVEAKVISTESFWDDNHRMIYTNNTLEVYKVFKGADNSPYINLVTEGGTVGLERVTSHPALELAIGEVGVFTCYLSVSPSSSTSKITLLNYKIYSGVQGFIKYNLASASATDPFYTYGDISTQVYTEITKQTGLPFLAVKILNTNSPLKDVSTAIAAVTISGFSPTTISAGTKSKLTITGSGFGATRGVGVVGFKNANDAGSTYINPLVSQYLSWKDNEIIVEVPSNAGSGTIRVVNGTTATSSTTLSILYAELNVSYDNGNGLEAFQTGHVNKNNTGGYTWKMNTSFNANSGAKSAIQRAFDSWKCKTNVNWLIGTTTSANVHGSDGINLISFDDNDPLPTGTLGTCFTFWSGCSSESLVWYVDEMDIIFDNGSNITPSTWQYGPAAPTTSQFDFETIALHELGHGRQLGHVINSSAVLNYAISSGQSRRVLSSSDISGGLDVQYRSTISNTCGPSAMTDFNGCLPEANFTSNKVSVCVNDSVQFNDVSSGTPTILAWVFSGGSPASSSLKNPKVKYSSPGSYSVTLSVTNANGVNVKTVSSYILVAEPVLSINTTAVFCFGTNTGNAIATAIGGISPYTYAWSNDSTFSTITNLFKGTYTCTVTDLQGCTAIKSAVISQPIDTLMISSSIVTDETCKKTNGVAAIVATGGTVGYTYSWSTSKTSNSINNLSEGSYTATVTDALGCVAQSIVYIQNIASPSLLLNINKPIVCNGDSAEVELIINGGVMPYTYLWNNGLGNSTTLNSLKFPHFDAGQYTITVMDKNACTSSDSLSVLEPPVINTLFNNKNVTCFNGNDGAIEMSVSGGVKPYTYLWNTDSATSHLSGLIASTYTCTITDSLGCVKIVSTTISELAPAITLNAFVLSDESCNNGNGKAYATATGGAGNFSYSWSNNVNGDTVDNLVASTYTVSVKDLNNCVSSDTVTIKNIAKPSIAVASINNSFCNGGVGSAKVTIAGGKKPYTYSWGAGNTGVTYFDSISLQNLLPNTYTFTLNDSSNCTTSTTISITEPATLSAIVVSTDIKCNPTSLGTIAVTPIGGTPSYKYVWNTGSVDATLSNLSAGTYTVTIIDSMLCTYSTSVMINKSDSLRIDSIVAVSPSCNKNNGSLEATASGGFGALTYTWSTGESTMLANNLYAGTYSLSVTDLKGCNNSTTILLQDSLAPVIDSVSTTSVLCKGFNTGTAKVFASATSPLTYTWSNSIKNQTATNLSAGTYTVSVADLATCVAFSIVEIGEPEHVFKIDTIVSAVEFCGNKNGVAKAICSGGIGTYTYSWNNGTNAQTATNLMAATYSVEVMDANTCTASRTVQITNSPPPILNLSISKAIACNGLFGDVAATISGGLAPFKYKWNDSITVDTTAVNVTRNNLQAGNYTLTILDANTCTATSNLLLAEPNLLNATITSTNLICFDDSTGSAVASGVGGTLPYSYKWSNDVLTDSINKLTASIYTLTLTDANNCETTSTVAITQSAKISIAINTTDFVCGQNYGIVSVSAFGGVGEKKYAWSSGDSSQTLTGLTSGNYTITVTDTNGCFAKSTTTVESILCVWPGDADYNGTANMEDLLMVGLGFNHVGKVRVGATNNWEEQKSSNWVNALPGVIINEKHADCNGDGIINAKDTVAISMNYRLIHNLKSPYSKIQNTLPNILYHFPVDTTPSGTTLSVPIQLENNLNPKDSLYGFSFSLFYDPDIVDTSRINFSPNNVLLGQNGIAVIVMQKNFGWLGRMDIGITKVDHKSISNFGLVGNLIIPVKNNISNLSVGQKYKTLVLANGQQRAVSNTGVNIPLSIGVDSVVVRIELPLSISYQSQNTDILVFPNPASAAVTISSSLLNIQSIKLINTLGEVLVYKNNLHQNSILLDIDQLPSGIYYLAISTSESTVLRPINILK